MLAFLADRTYRELKPSRSPSVPLDKPQICSLYLRSIRLIYVEYVFGLNGLSSDRLHLMMCGEVDHPNLPLENIRVYLLYVYAKKPWKWLTSSDTELVLYWGYTFRVRELVRASFHVPLLTPLSGQAHFLAEAYNHCKGVPLPRTRSHWAPTVSFRVLISSSTSRGTSLGHYLSRFPNRCAQLVFGVSRDLQSWWSTNSMLAIWGRIFRCNRIIPSNPCPGAKTGVFGHACTFLVWREDSVKGFGVDSMRRSVTLATTTSTEATTGEELKQRLPEGSSWARV